MLGWQADADFGIDWCWHRVSKVPASPPGFAASGIAKRRLSHVTKAPDLPLDFSPWCENGLLLLSASLAIRSGRGHIRLD